MNKSMYIRIPIVIIGIFLFFLGLFNLIQEYYILYKSFFGGELEDIGEVFTKSVTMYIIIFWGLLIFYIGRHWKDSLKHISYLMTHFSAIFISIGILFLSINIYSEDITNSIQPSIDYILANAVIDNLLETSGLEVLEGEEVSVIVSENLVSEVFETNNITTDQSDFLLDKLGIEESFTKEDKIYLGNFLVSFVYSEIEKNQEALLNSPISIDFLVTLLGEENKVILTQIKPNNIETMKSFYSINEDAKLDIIISEDTKTLTLTIASLTKEEITEVWNSLDLDNNLSIEDKENNLDLMLSVLSVQMENNNFNNLTIPLSTFKNLIPADFKNILNYAILNENKSIVANEISRLRDDCINKIINTDIICSQLSLTSYNNIIETLDSPVIVQENATNENFNSNSIEELDLNQIIELESINSLDKVETKIIDFSNSYKKWFLFGFLFLILAIILYTIHFFKFKDAENFPIIIIPYEVSKWNFYSFLSSFILILFLYIFLKFLLNEVLDSLSSKISESYVSLEFILELPLFIILTELIETIFYYSLFYVIFTFLIFITIFILIKHLKSDVKSYE